MNTSTEKTVAQSMREGFTLIEILVAVAIIGILATAGVVGVPQLLESARERSAADAVQTLRNGVVAFKMQYPSKKFTELKQLVEGDDDHPPVIDGGEKVLTDPWGTDYKYEKHGKRFAIICAGPDQEMGTEDDIRSDAVKNSASEK